MDDHRDLGFQDWLSDWNSVEFDEFVRDPLIGFAESSVAADGDPLPLPNDHRHLSSGAVLSSVPVFKSFAAVQHGTHAPLPSSTSPSPSPSPYMSSSGHAGGSSPISALGSSSLTDVTAVPNGSAMYNWHHPHPFQARPFVSNPVASWLSSLSAPPQISPAASVADPDLGGFGEFGFFDVRSSAHVANATALSGSAASSAIAPPFHELDIVRSPLISPSPSASAPLSTFGGETENLADPELSSVAVTAAEGGSWYGEADFASAPHFGGVDKFAPPPPKRRPAALGARQRGAPPHGPRVRAAPSSRATPPRTLPSKALSRRHAAASECDDDSDEDDSSLGDGDSLSEMSCDDLSESNSESQQRGVLASRRYRRRMAKRIAELRGRSELLTEQRDHLRTLVNKKREDHDAVRRENADLKLRYEASVSEVYSQKLEALKRLEDLLRSNAPDEILQECLSSSGEHVRKVILHGNGLSREMGERDSLDLLVMRGALEGDSESGGSATDMREFVNSMVKSIPGLSAPQMQAIDSVVVQHSDQMCEVMKRRQAAVAQLQEADRSSMSDLMLHLEPLRASLQEQTRLFEGTLDAVLSVLTVRQQAMLMVKVSFENYSLLQLRLLWDALQQPRASPHPPPYSSPGAEDSS